LTLCQDEGDDGAVMYSLVDGDAETFGLFPDGRLYLRGPLDREEKAYYAVTVRASDKGSPRKYKTKKVSSPNQEVHLLFF